MRWSVLALGVFVSCGSSQTPRETALAPTESPQERVEPSTAAPPLPRASAAPATPQAEAGQAEPVAEAEWFAGTTFPPPPIAPPHERSRQDGDGQWQPLGSSESGDRLAEGTRVAYRTVIHPHVVSRWAKLTVVAIDLSGVRVGYVPGKADVESLKALGGSPPAPSERVGVVPDNQREALLVVFNGGFKPRHGRWGMRAGGTTLLPPRDEGCTVAVDQRGLVRVASWERLSQRESEPVSFRQTPPCLTQDGAIHPLLAQHNERPWSGFDPKRKTRRRSAVGVDASGRVLFYGLGEEMDPRVLAQGMLYAGAVNSAELDINWSWTRFLLFGQTRAGGLGVTSTLIDPMVFQPGEYLKRDAARDFFFLTRRSTPNQASSGAGGADRP